jgi:acetylornithine deacetylase/succinyl-diaminopimelate desuccinylase-like protein
MAHQTDEYCSTERIALATDAFGELIRRWCGV